MDVCTSLARFRKTIGLETVWQPFLALALIGTVLFFLSLARFRKTIGQMA